MLWVNAWVAGSEMGYSHIEDSNPEDSDPNDYDEIVTTK